MTTKKFGTTFRCIKELLGLRVSCINNYLGAIFLKIKETLKRKEKL